MTPSWYAATPLITLRDALNRHWPHRDHASDGFIGDARHAATKSDHNPDPHSNPPGCVRGGDYDADGIDAAFVAEHLRQLGAAGDQRLHYVIYNRRYTGPDSGWRWVEYTGEDPHTSHIHVSTAPAGDRDDAGWPFLEAPQSDAGPVPAHPGRVPAHHDATGHGEEFRAELGDQGPNVERMQHALNEEFPSYSHLEEDGIFGHETASVLEEFAHREAVDPVTPPPHADVEGLAQSDGEAVGPRTARAFLRDSIRL